MKKYILILLSILSIGLCGCLSEYEDPFQVTPADQTYSALQTRIPLTTFPVSTDSNIETPSVTNSVWTPIPTKTPTPTKAPVSTRKIATKTQLRDYITENVDKEIYDITFEYTSGRLDYSEICRMSKGICSVNVTEKNNVYNVKLTPYPGKRIVDAYFSNDTSKLNNDELKAYNKAVSIVNEAKSKTKDMIDLELYLHDYLIDTVDYDDHTREITDANDPPHNLTAVGALVDGRANCQGYTDAFYTLATMAGFEVSYMSTYSNGDLHQVNTIKLNGSWYVVDVTFNDLDGVSYNKSAKVYYLFNVGRDLIFDVDWHEQNEVNPVAKASSNYFYYNYYNKKYQSADAFTSVVANGWKAGIKEVHGTVSADPKALEASLNNALNSVTDQSVYYSYWYTTDGTVYYYQVLFE